MIYYYTCSIWYILIMYYFILLMFCFPGDGSDLRSASRRSVSFVCVAVRHCVITRSVFLLRLFQTAERIFLFYLQFFLSVWTFALHRMLVCSSRRVWSDWRETRREQRVFGGVLLRMFMNRPNERGSIKHWDLIKTRALASKTASVLKTDALCDWSHWSDWSIPHQYLIDNRGALRRCARTDTHIWSVSDR